MQSTSSVPTKLPFLTLLLLISFASVNAVLFTPALPAIAQYFAVSEQTAQLTVTWFLVGYALAQLIYSPFANRFGRKPAIYVGVGLEIFSSLLSVFAGFIHVFWVLVLGRFLLAISSGVGLKMTFTLVNEVHESCVANQKISYLIMAFAILPGLGIALGGLLNTHFGWMSCFYASAIYGVILLILSRGLPETLTVLDLDAFNLKHLTQAYLIQFKNLQLVLGGLLMGFAGCFIYVFNTLAPFIAINLLGMTSSTYGVTNLIPSVGLFLGGITSAKLSSRFSFYQLIVMGIIISTLGAFLMLVTLLVHMPVILSLFLSAFIAYFGTCFLFANASSLALSHAIDKAHGSAVMSFINMGTITLVILSLSAWPIKVLSLPIIYLMVCVVLLILMTLLGHQQR